MKKLTLIAMCLALVVVGVVVAQDDDEAQEVELIGIIEAIDDDTITIDGLEIDLSEVEELEELEEGDVVRIEGVMEDDVVIASEVEIVDEERLDTIEADADEETDEDVDCENVPPPWAKAKGWRARCEDGDNTLTGDDAQLQSDDNDDDSCQNAPPPWAKAKGWRARCEDGDNTVTGDDTQLRSDDSCQNAPPPWAKAKGWRERCVDDGQGSRSSKSN